MPELWNALLKKFHTGGKTNQTTRWVEFIARMLFFVVFMSVLEDEDTQKRFAEFMGVKGYE